jgi:hypothetical protein
MSPPAVAPNLLRVIRITRSSQISEHADALRPETGATSARKIGTVRSFDEAFLRLIDTRMDAAAAKNES